MNSSCYSYCNNCVNCEMNLVKSMTTLYCSVGWLLIFLTWLWPAGKSMVTLVIAHILTLFLYVDFAILL